MSSGLPGSGPTEAPSTEKNEPENVTDGDRQQQPQQRQRLVEHRRALPRRAPGTGPVPREPRAASRTPAAPAQAPARPATRAAWPPAPGAARQHRDPAARLEPRGSRQRERDPDKRLHRRGVDGLRQPQRVDPGRLEQVDGGREVGRLRGAQRDSDPDFHENQLFRTYASLRPAAPCHRGHPAAQSAWAAQPAWRTPAWAHVARPHASSRMAAPDGPSLVTSATSVDFAAVVTTFSAE